MMVNIKLSSLKLTRRSTLGETYEMTIKEIALDSRLSIPSQNSLHQQTLGRNPTIDDGLDAEVYAFDLSACSIYLDRTEAKAHLRILSVDLLQCGVLISQWPSPWLTPSRFLSGDPNAPLLTIRISIGSVETTERLEILQRLVADAKSTPSSSNPLLPSILSPVPRMNFALNFGSFCGHIICVDPCSSEPFAMEARTDGFALSVHSHFLHAVRRNNLTNEHPDQLPLQMNFGISLVLKPTFLRVRSDRSQGRFSTLNVTESDNLGDSVIGLETLEIIGQGSAIGALMDDAENVVSMETSSFFLDLHCSTDALSVELWHPSVITTTSIILSVMGNKLSGTLPATSPVPFLDRLPVGLSCTLTLARLVLLVTGPDLNPDEDMDITRGIALRTGVSMHYCAVRYGHVQSFRSLPVRSQTRQKLYLPEERTTEAVAAANSSTATQQIQTLMRISFWDTVLRSAAATQYVADDPRIAERDDPVLKAREFLQIRSARADINLSGKRGHAGADRVKDICHFSLHVPYVRGTFQLVHIYGLLLAAHTVKSIMRHRVHVHRLPVQKAPGSMIFRFKGTIRILQVFWNLPSQRFATRIDSINAHYSPNEQFGVGCDSLLFWVPVPCRLHKWDENTEGKWEEFGRLQRWSTSLRPSSDDQSIILVEGDSARLRIPSGFVLADLILDLSLTIKCLRHLTHMVAVGFHSNMPMPTAEVAKTVPNLIVRMGCLLLEAADDPLETRLGLIWQAGSEACKQRLDREDAFKAKVAAILAAETHASSRSVRESDSDYQFSATHTTSVEDARVRLSMVHAVDWSLRLQEAKNKRSRQERELKQRFLGQNALKCSVDVPNLVTVAVVEDVPPLFRSVFHDLHLKVSKPSFSDSTLPDFLHEQGNGIPRDTQFSLLLPMHVNFSLNSLQVCLRDYPVPLLDIPGHSKKDTSVLEFDTDLVIAEEMGTQRSLDWIKCRVVGMHSDIHGAKPMWIAVPKTMMPVKSYANPMIHVAARDVTSFAWGVSYGAATQDLTRVLETLSTAPRDSSPHLGFWDKVR